MFQCPKCHKSDNLKIAVDVAMLATVDSEGNVQDSEQVGGCEWDDTNQATCAECDWIGNVEQMTTKDDDSESDDANREMGLPEGQDWGDK